MGKPRLYSSMTACLLSLGLKEFQENCKNSLVSACISISLNWVAQYYSCLCIWYTLNIFNKLLPAGNNYKNTGWLRLLPQFSRGLDAQLLMMVLWVALSHSMTAPHSLTETSPLPWNSFREGNVPRETCYFILLHAQPELSQRSLCCSQVLFMVD